MLSKQACYTGDFEIVCSMCFPATDAGLYNDKGIKKKKKMADVCAQISILTNILYSALH